ncbi:MAG: cbb3-type cytochrome oxidase assembly protein CcoS [FCB group bacterium]|nr:cbb3-type cytochrome oxidase assembly protein CcoS [FCB group bacterium]
MNALILLITASLFVAIGFLITFLWAVKSGQFEDTHTPAFRILLDGNGKPVDKNKEQKQGNSNGR